MKILFLFCDMLRANRLTTFNPAISTSKPMDRWMRKLGGTAFRSCYSPAPDSPRALACLYTGLYPKRNGCNKRIRYPGYYLDRSATTIFGFFRQEGFQLYSHFSDLDLNVGMLPEGVVNDSINEQSLVGMVSRVEKADVSENALVFAYLPDYHHAVTDYGGSPYSDIKGNNLLVKSLDNLTSKLSPDKFDYILLFSDHGCKLNDDRGLNKKIGLLNDDRSQIVMFLHKRGDEGIKNVDTVTSICDVFPTMVELIGGNPAKFDTDGISLLHPAEQRAVVIEDHTSFTSAVGSFPSTWAVRTDSHFYFEDVDDRLLFSVMAPGRYQPVSPIPEDLKTCFSDMLNATAAYYGEIMREKEILSYYQQLTNLSFHYSDGSRRPGPTLVKARNLIGSAMRRLRRF